MARGHWVRVNDENAERLQALIDANPDITMTALVETMKCSRRTLAKIAALRDIELPQRPHFRGTRNRHPLLNPLFVELARRNISLVEIGRQLQTSTFSIYRLRNGEREPRLFEVECLATMAGMRLALEPDKRVERV